VAAWHPTDVPPRPSRTRWLTVDKKSRRHTQHTAPGAWLSASMSLVAVQQRGRDVPGTVSSPQPFLLPSTPTAWPSAITAPAVLTPSPYGWGHRGQQSAYASPLWTHAKAPIGGCRRSCAGVGVAPSPTHQKLLASVSSAAGAVGVTSWARCCRAGFACLPPPAAPPRPIPVLHAPTHAATHTCCGCAGLPRGVLAPRHRHITHSPGGGLCHPLSPVSPHQGHSVPQATALLGHMVAAAA
jgi:hypothetical protein